MVHVCDGVLCFLSQSYSYVDDGSDKVINGEPAVRVYYQGKYILKQIRDVFFINNLNDMVDWMLFNDEQTRQTPLDGLFLRLIA